MSKGDTRREASVERGEYERRWEKSFNQPWGTRAERDAAAQRFVDDPGDMEMEIDYPVPDDEVGDWESPFCVTKDEHGFIVFTTGERA